MPMTASSDVLNRAAKAGLDALVAEAEGTFGADQVAVCACIYHRPLTEADPGPFSAQSIWHHRGAQQIYPASVCKMFYLAALAASQAEGRIVLDDEDHRAIRAMIGISSNDATTYLLGRLTGAHDGPALDAAGLEGWIAARGRVQTWVDGLAIPALQGIHLLHSTYEDSPYGRARQARLARPGNQLSAIACAAMLHEMLRGALPGRDWMANHLSRDWQRGEDSNAEGDQATGFLTGGIPQTFRVWSKAGHTSWTRHDVISLATPDGRGATIAVMTEGHAAAANTRTLPAFARAFTDQAFG
ncbi:serine hydrolase [Paracoccus litorisediminis]|uniref:serine hydrolase n=1 Tax=Paracoccus litorisediminis TaxID=2006130 RepID=UPI003731BF1D